MTAGSIVAGLEGSADAKSKPVPLSGGVVPEFTNRVATAPSEARPDAEPRPDRASRRVARAQAKAAARDERARSEEDARLAQESVAAEKAAAANKATKDKAAADKVVADQERLDAVRLRQEGARPDGSEPAGPPPGETPPEDPRQLRAEAKAASRSERDRPRTTARDERARVKDEARIAKGSASQAKADSKQQARSERSKVREAAAAENVAARVAAAAARSAARVDTRTAELQSPEVSDDSQMAPAEQMVPAEPSRPEPDVESEASLVDAARRARQEREAVRAGVHERETDQDETVQAETDQEETDPEETDQEETDQDETDQDETDQAETDQAETDQAETDQDEQTDRDVKSAERQRRADSKHAARKAGRRASAAKVADDHIVEAPREPKVSPVERLRRKAAAGSEARAQAKINEPGRAKAKSAPKSVAAGPSGSATDSSARRRNAILVLAGAVGAVGLICSVLLAAGALVVARGIGDDNASVAILFDVCDALIGPLRDVFAFSGTNGDLKNTLVAYGLGSLGYLVVGLAAQSFLRSRADA
ncbi:hypothetical protein [Aeromicrobium sp.]|uniref:hypothetical protein n=1 Tax=Aeromicrobium sp. TaxID=1871063 RepID=UPI00198F1E27|nr:hypothetical protein [Aeromicrobium sp.]MBC7633725.1 hypothetical protein [Aeromicrobium sp.]